MAGPSRDKQLVLAAAAVLLLVAVVALALGARSTRAAPEPVAGLTPDHVELALADGLEIRVNAIATQARAAQAEEAAAAALGGETVERLRSSVHVSLARVRDASGAPLSRRLVWVVHADGVVTPPLDGGASAGVPDPARTFVVVDPDSLSTLPSVVQR